MKILVARTWYDEKWTGGIMLVDYAMFGYTLEDPVRFTPKIPEKTAIPAGLYEVRVDMSNRFKKLMPRLLSVPGFTGVRIHGGTTAADTGGCILVAKETDRAGKVWGARSGDLTQKLLAALGPHWIEVINTRQW